MNFLENLSFSQVIVFIFIIFIFFFSTFKLILDAYFSTKETINKFKNKNKKNN